MLSDTLQILGIRPYDKRRLTIEKAKETKRRLLGLEGKPNKAKRGLIEKDQQDMTDLTLDQATILVEFEEESQRVGNYEMIYPHKDSMDYYA